MSRPYTLCFYAPLVLTYPVVLRGRCLWNEQENPLRTCVLGVFQANGRLCFLTDNLFSN